MRRINWVTGGRVSSNWAYGVNCRNLISKLHNYSHEIDLNIDVCQIVVFFDILIMQKLMLNFPKAKKVLRLSGIRPFNVLKARKIDYRKISDKADWIVSVGGSSPSDLFDNQSNISLIPNSVNTSVFNDTGYVKPKEFTVGFSGNISTPEQREWKGYNLVEIAAKQSNVKLLTALRGKFEIPHEDMVKKFYHKISCLVQMSISEGCSNTISEALACGLPIITYKGPGYHTNEMVDDENIMFCYKRELEYISKCINLLKNDNEYWNRLHENGQKFVRENQDLNIISKQWEEVFKKL